MTSNFDKPAIQDAVAEIVEIIRLDGADLVVRDIDGDHIAFSLVLEGASCPECVMPASLLEDMASQRLREEFGRDLSVTIEDPRVGSQPPDA